ncbi:MAG: Hsp20/alpha crystallin family protein [Alphaproteobacteria bacterium]|nr:Hsp20/alpha crystallin family protein [Alphaproteobacteria bacterium]
MATAPVDVKRTAVSAPRAPDVFRSFRTDMDRVFDRFAGAFGLPSVARMLDLAPDLRSEGGFTLPAPAVDIAEDETSFKLTAELPGMSEKEIEVAISGDTLTIKGEKRQESEKTGKNYHMTERAWGAFQRSFMLPDGVDRDKIAGEFAKGVLTLTLPKTAKAQQQQKKIEIKAAA